MPDFSGIANTVGANFGGFVFGLIMVLAAYAAIGIWYPQYAAAFAMVTLLGIAMFWLNKKKS